MNALCQTVLHRHQCSCPQCYSGQPLFECLRITGCEVEGPARRVSCKENKDCPSNEACLERECVDPCAVNVAVARASGTAVAHSCEPLKKCVTRNHQPVCICKFGFYLTENGELSCAPEQMECTADEECATSYACSKGKCRNPCATDQPLCDANKTCAVINHRPVCLCLEDCNPSVSVCLRDAGCSSDTVCRNYECIDPCVNITCPEGEHCFVDEHVPVCKACAEGWTFDSKQGCIQRSKKFVLCFGTENLISDYRRSVVGAAVQILGLESGFPDLLVIIFFFRFTTRIFKFFLTVYYNMGMVFGGVTLPRLGNDTEVWTVLSGSNWFWKSE